MNAVKHPLPPEYRRQIPSGPLFGHVNEVLETEKLNTICVSGKCPNRGECFSRGSLAFMILGDTCTRHCGFCAVKAGQPNGIVDETEPERLGRAAAALKLRHVVVTAVARDDLKDGGASIFAESVRQLRRFLPTAIVEVLTSDYNGDQKSIDTVLESGPDIYNHNMETVERLTPKVRSRATYRQSLDVLDYAKRHRRQTTMKTKSGMMLGLGETREEIQQTLEDLRSVACDYLTIGQYLQPSAKHLTIQSFVPMDDFNHWHQEATRLGFERVASGPLVRSSYFADELHFSSVSPAGRRPGPTDIDHQPMDPGLRPAGMTKNQEIPL
jgi:lipoic acid synthetase